jgi:hypothetical protein
LEINEKWNFDGAIGANIRAAGETLSSYQNICGCLHHQELFSCELDSTRYIGAVQLKHSGRLQSFAGNLRFEGCAYRVAALSLDNKATERSSVYRFVACLISLKYNRKKVRKSAIFAQNIAMEFENTKLSKKINRALTISRPSDKKKQNRS